MARFKYHESNSGLNIILEVVPPMGAGSGFIPPPVITFFKDGNERPFVYQGNESDG